MLACSGTGGMEAALVNVLSPGDKMVALVAGNFGERWANIGKAYGMDVQVLKAGWGDAVPPEEVARALDADPAIKGVFVQLSESLDRRRATTSRPWPASRAGARARSSSWTRSPARAP